ncbi:hypothetical protein [Synechococcus sp. PCC 7502]|uniref:hypothetical protein n=1 Tax=Synechococcus sp. PCC 7502 TaxID=1173263 RepID=UPI00059B8BCE|nr:hypothetical protein [Synechococcus sp. PCC 7502]
MPVILVPKDLGVKAIIRVCSKCYLSAIAGLIGISFFLLPVILDQPLVQIENVINFSSEYVPQKRLMLDGLLSLAPRLPTHWFESGFGLIPCFGIIAVTGMIGAIAWIISLKLKTLDPRLFRAFGIGVLVTLITILMTTDLAIGIYELFPTLQKIQFSWRWFVITVTTAPLIWGGIIWQLGRLHTKWLRNLLLIFLMLVTLASYSFTDKLILDKTGFDSPLVHKFVTFANQKKFPQEPQVNSKGTPILFWHWLFPDGLGIVDVSEYRAKGISMAMPPDRNYPLAAWKDRSSINNPQNNQIGIQIKTWNYGFRQLEIANPHDLSCLQLRMFYYPRWQLKIDDQNSALTATEQGQVEIAIPSGEHSVTLTYTGTIAEQVGKYISLVSIIGTLIWLIWDRSQQKLAKSS